MTTAPEPVSATGAAGAAYAGYEEWKGWTRFFAFDAEEAEYFAGELRGLPPLAAASVLEMGFGTGSFIAWARAQGAAVAGTEVNDRLCAEARRAGVDLLDPAIETIATPNAGRFDLIAAFDVFEHFDIGEIDARMRAIEAMLKPGGHAILRFPNGQSPFGLQPQHGDITHKTALSRSRIEQLTQGSTLSTVRYAGSYSVRGPLGLKRSVRLVRRAAQRIVGFTLDFVYATHIPWEPVVVIVMRKSPAGK